MVGKPGCRLAWRGNSADADEDDGFSPHRTPQSLFISSNSPTSPVSLTLLVSSVLGFTHLKDRMVTRMPKGAQQA